MIQDILKHGAIKNLVKKTFNGNETQVLERPHSYIIRRKRETHDVIIRIIILLPYGCTANRRDELTPHDEVRKAKIIIHGVLLTEKRGFSLRKNILRYSYLIDREATTERDRPYARIVDNQNIWRNTILSSKQTMYVVRENGVGFYHNMINQTDRPLVISLVKELRSGKKMDINKKVRELKLSIPDTALISELMNKIQAHGDQLFTKDSNLVKRFFRLRTNISLPILIEALNMYETGKHEPCTVYALILKKAKTHTREVLDSINKAIGERTAPFYYLHELVNKISRQR